MRFTALLLISLLSVSGCSIIRHAGHRHHDKSDDDAPPPAPQYDTPATAMAVRSDHPRLMIDSMPMPDPLLAHWRTLLIARGRETLSKPLIAYARAGLLTRSREALQRLTLFGGLYQITHDPAWADAARREMLNVCSFPDWQPNDFLATAEMMNAVAIAYDWAYDALSPDERATIQDALISKGLSPALTAYSSHGGWTTAHHNWNLVCNGGVIVAALAIIDERPVPAQRCLRLALASIPNGLSAYDAAGGTAEGPMYHNYATRYLTFAAAALSTAPQTPISLAEEDGRWAKAGDYRIAMTGPTGKCANFGDCADVVGNSGWMFWHARQFHRPDYAAFEAAIDAEQPSVFDYFWYAPPGPGPNLQLAQLFGSAGVLRNHLIIIGRNDPTETFVAARIGSTAGNHTHLDLGTFVLDMLGQRFASDLGADNYDLPGYLGNRRGEYLRSSTPGHNTLSIAGASQPLDATAAAQIIPASGDRSLVRINLTEAYPGASKIIREIGVDPSGAVGITDYIKLAYPAPIVWNLHTAARVTLGKHGAMLDLGGKHVELRVLEPADARIDARPDATEPPALPVEGMTHLRIIAASGRETQFKIEFAAVR